MIKSLKPVELFVRKVFNSVIGITSSEPEVITTPTRLLTSDSPRILILRQDRIGDVLVSTPLMQAIRHAYPQAHIGMVLSTNNIAVKGALEGLVDAIHVYEKGVQGMLNIRRQLRKGQYDIVVDSMDNPSATSALLCKGSGAPIRVGIDKANRLVYTHVVPLLDRSTVHIVDRLLQLALAFGVSPSEHSYMVRYPIAQEILLNVKAQLPQNALGRLVLWNISGSDASRMYSIEKTIIVLKQLRQEFPHITFLIAASPVHVELQKEVVKETGCLAAPIFADFTDFAAMVSCASLVVTGDTSVVHVTAAFTIPSVVMYMHSNKSLLPWYPYKVQSTALTVDSNSVADIDTEILKNAVTKALGVL